MRDILQKCRLFVIYTGIFSFVINILLLTPPLYLLNALDRVLSSRSVETLVMLTLLAIFALTISSLLETVRTKLLNRFSITLHHLLGRPTLAAILDLKQQEGQTKHGIDDVDILQNFITTRGVKAVFDIPWIPVYVAILFYFHITLAMFALAAIVILLLLAIWETKVTKNTQLQVGAYSRASKDFLELAYRNQEIISSLGMQETISKRWWVRNEEYLNRKNLVENKLATIQAITRLVHFNIKILALGTAAYYVISDNMSPGIMIASNIILSKAIEPISSVIAAGKSFVDAKGAYNRLDRLLNSRNEKNIFMNLPAPTGQVSVEKVFFYLNQDRNILNGISFKLKAGDCLCIIGSSASGKTTLAKMLVGFYKPKDGFVRLDGADVSSWSKNGLGPYIGYLPQDIQLFSGSIAENIARLDNVQSNEAKIIAAAKKARIHDMILQLPQGYDTDIGERGSKLSGGQRQRIGIARAVYGNPKFIVLDEPNSNLDGQAELELVEMLEELKQQKVTVVVITHKPNLAEIADKMLALHEGKCVKFASRQEVLAQIKMG
ncbi:MAG: type I secretion system permease/ATPase [Methylococcaceae bacterium]